jgi:hypothetical protein
MLSYSARKMSQSARVPSNLARADWHFDCLTGARAELNYVMYKLTAIVHSPEYLAINNLALSYSKT